MSQKMTQLRLFASSTSETSAEISALRKVIDGLNKQLESTHAITLRMLSWPDDIRPGVNTDPQAEINRQVADYDIYLGLLGTRFGTPTPRSESGTQEEFEEALSRFKRDMTSVRLLFYFKSSLAGINPYELNAEELRQVQRFRDNLKARGVLYRDFADTGEFIELVKTHLFSLIVEEWENDKWTLVNTQAQEPPIKQQRPKAVLDDGSGDTGKPKTGVGESTGHAPPDEDDLEESDEALGFLDHVENLHSTCNALVKTFNNMSEHIILVGKKFVKRTEEINAVKQSLAKSRTADGPGQQRNASQLKQIINVAADDLEQFAGELIQDVDAYRTDNRVMLSALRAVLATRQELDLDGSKELTSLLELVVNMKTVKDQVGGFQQAMRNAPALTGRFKKARRRGVSMLGELIAEVSFSIDEVEVMTRELAARGES